jgi:hypothetical protein
MRARRKAHSNAKKANMAQRERIETPAGKIKWGYPNQNASRKSRRNANPKNGATVLPPPLPGTRQQKSARQQELPCASTCRKERGDRGEHACRQLCGQELSHWGQDECRIIRRDTGSVQRGRKGCRVPQRGRRHIRIGRKGNGCRACIRRSRNMREAGGAAPNLERQKLKQEERVRCQESSNKKTERPKLQQTYSRC